MDNKNLYVLTVIHARGGSVRVPLKNIKPLCGKPLVAWLVEASLDSKLVNRTIVSTDHPEIIRISKKFGADVPFVRPADISEDVPSELVTQHAVNFVEKELGRKIDIAVTIQPTTPFCTPEDVDNVIQMLIDTDADSVVSMTPVKERPEWMFSMDERCRTKSLMAERLSGDWGVVQKLPKLYVPNGGIYATKRDVLMNQNTIYGPDNRAYIMPHERSIDIDEEIDFFLAEVVYKHKINPNYKQPAVKKAAKKATKKPVKKLAKLAKPAKKTLKKPTKKAPKKSAKKSPKKVSRKRK